MNNTVLVEIVATVLIVAYAIYFFMQMSEADMQRPFSYTYRKMMEEFNNPQNIIYMIGYLIVIYGVIYLANVKKINGKYPHSIRFLEYKSWIFMIILLGVQLYNIGTEKIDLFKTH